MNFLISDEPIKTNYLKSISLSKKYIYYDSIFYFFKIKKKSFLIFGKIFQLKIKNFSYNLLKKNIAEKF